MFILDFCKLSPRLGYLFSQLFPLAFNLSMGWVSGFVRAFLSCDRENTLSQPRLSIGSVTDALETQLQGQ